MSGWQSRDKEVHRMFPFLKSKKVIGVDIGSSSIKIVEADSGSQSIDLLAFGIAPTPDGAVSNGEIVDPPAIAATVRGLIDDIGTKRKLLSTAMSGSAVMVRKITIPKIEKKFIRDQVRFEAEQNIPFDINQIVLSHHVLSHSSSIDTMDVLLVAAQNVFISQIHQVCGLIGLECGVLDVAGFALANTFEANYGRLPGTVGIFNFGASSTSFVVLLNGEVVFYRDIPVGGILYTSEIHKNLGLTLPEAESLKIAASTSRDVPDEVHSILSAMNEQTAEEVRNILEVLSASSNGLSLNRCFYSGGSAATPGLIDAASKAAGVKFEYFNPALRVKANSKKFSAQYLNQIAPFMSVSLGLSLRKVGDSE